MAVNFAIQVVAKKEYFRPRFTRTYIANITDTCRLEVEMYSAYSGPGRSNDSKLVYGKDQALKIDIQNLQDKLLSVDLMQQLNKTVAEILRIDADYASTQTKSFEDDGGLTWRRE